MLSASGLRPDQPSHASSALPRNVHALGWVAFLNDTATEMSYWLLPHFLVTVLGAGPMVFGLIEGAAETVASFGRFLAFWRTACDGASRSRPWVTLSPTWLSLFLL